MEHQTIERFEGPQNDVIVLISSVPNVLLWPAQAIVWTEAWVES